MKLKTIIPTGKIKKNLITVALTITGLLIVLTALLLIIVEDFSLSKFGGFVTPAIVLWTLRRVWLKEEVIEADCEISNDGQSLIVYYPSVKLGKDLVSRKYTVKTKDEKFKVSFDGHKLKIEGSVKAVENNLKNGNTENKDFGVSAIYIIPTDPISEDDILKVIRKEHLDIVEEVI